jgi:hypothetical protein
MLVGEERLGRLMVAELLQCVGQHRIFHGNEQLGKTFHKIPPYLVRQCRCGFDTSTV